MKGSGTMQEKVSYEEINTLVMAYQDGSSDAVEQLLTHYERYFQKYVSVLSGHFSIQDKTQRNFVSLFIRDPKVKANANLYRKSEYIRRVLYATVVNIQDTYKHFEPDELKNEMIILFLSMAESHNFKAPFPTYVGLFFPLKFYKVIRKMVCNGIEEVPFDEEDIRTAYFEDYEIEEKPKYFIQSTTPTDYDQNWVNGYNCGQVFAELNAFERRLLKLYYEWKARLDKGEGEGRRTEEDIAEILGCSRKTVNLKRNDIKRRLQITATELHLLKD